MTSVLLHFGYTMDPYEIKSPKAPDYWVDPPPNTSNGKPTLDKVEKPGGWISFSYRPVFASVSQGGQYKACCLPDGCQTVPLNKYDAAILTHGGWIFLPRVE